MKPRVSDFSEARGFLYHRKLRKINLAVLRCLDTRITAIGEQLRVGVAHFFDDTRIFGSLAALKAQRRGLKKNDKVCKLFRLLLKHTFLLSF